MTVLEAHPYRLWRRVTAVSLTTTAVAKVVGLLLHSSLLEGVEPMTGLPLRLVAASSAAGELGLAAGILASGRVVGAASVTLVLAAAGLGYRLLIAIPGAPCPCLGGISKWLPWMALYERNILLLMLLWWLVTSAGILVHERFRLRVVA